MSEENRFKPVSSAPDLDVPDAKPKSIDRV
jgi:hypothetical protein